MMDDEHVLASDGGLHGYHWGLPRKRSRPTRTTPSSGIPGLCFCGLLGFEREKCIGSSLRMILR